MKRSMGMVQVDGIAYRIDRVREEYEAVRLLDDTSIGRFGDVADSAALSGSSAESRLLQAVARAAKQQGRTEWRPPHIARHWRKQTVVEAFQQLVLLRVFWRAHVRAPAR